MTSSGRLRLGVALILLLGGALMSPLFGLILKLFVDAFAIGDSFAKVYLLLILLIVCVSIPALYIPNKLEKATSLLVLALLLLSLLEHCSLMNQMGLPFHGAANFVMQGDYSTTRLEHIHVPKAALGLLMPRMSYQFDAGMPYENFFPRTLLFFQLGLLLLASCGAVLSIVKQRERGLGPLLSSCLVWYTLMKATVDGGPLNAELLAVLPFHLEQVWNKPWKKVASVVWPLYLLAMTVCFGQGFLRLYHLVSTSLFLGLLSLLEKRRALLISGLILAQVTLAPPLRNLTSDGLRYSGHAFNVLPYMMGSLNAGDIIFVNKAGPILESPLTRIEKTSTQGPYSLCQMKVLRDCSMYQVCRAQALNLNRFPIQQSPQENRRVSIKLWQPGDPKGEFRDEVFELPAGATINYLVAGLPSGAVFRGVKVLE